MAAREIQEVGASRARRRRRGIDSEHVRAVRERVAKAKGIEIVTRRMVTSVAPASPGFDALRRLQRRIAQRRLRQQG